MSPHVAIIALMTTMVLAFTVNSEAEPDLNVTALKGENAVLPCSIDSLAANISVVWMDKLDNVLYYDENRMIDDDRFTLSKSKADRSWDLMIRKVDAQDEGTYRCIANTNPIKLKYYQLTVFVPPKIDIENASPDIEATEGTSVRLFCNATGYPSPTISWSFRSFGEPINSSDVKKISQTGSTVNLHNVTRYMNEIYTCSASNGHGVDTHDIKVQVRFKPEMRTSRKKLSQYKGKDVNLTCEAKGYRRPRMYFAKDSLEIYDDPLDQEKYKYVWQHSTDGYRSRMTLQISNLQEKDFGYYKCVAINSLARVEKFIEVKEVKVNMAVKPITGVRSSPRNIPQSTLPPTTNRRAATSKLTLPPELAEGKGDQPNSAIAKQSIKNAAVSLTADYVIYYLTIYAITVALTA